MGETLFAIDKSIFHFINETMSNRVFDAIMPAMTDWNKSPIGLGIFGVLWLLLMWKGGSKGRIIGGLLILLVIIGDQLNSSVLKQLFARPRPCHDIGGIPAAGHLRLLVDCGSGYSFPSSHAVNNTSLAVFLAYYYRRWSWLLGIYAFLMCLSRVVVGAHYPFDVVAGAMIGGLLAMVLIHAWRVVAKNYPACQIEAVRTSA